MHGLQGNRTLRSRSVLDWPCQIAGIASGLSASVKGNGVMLSEDGQMPCDKPGRNAPDP